MEQRAERVGSLIAHQGHRHARKLDVGYLHPRRDLGELHHRRQQRPQQSRLRFAFSGATGMVCTYVQGAVLQTSQIADDGVSKAKVTSVRCEYIRFAEVMCIKSSNKRRSVCPTQNEEGE